MESAVRSWKRVIVGAYAHNERLVVHNQLITKVVVEIDVFTFDVAGAALSERARRLTESGPHRGRKHHLHFPSVFATRSVSNQGDCHPPSPVEMPQTCLRCSCYSRRNGSHNNPTSRGIPSPWESTMRTASSGSAEATDSSLSFFHGSDVTCLASPRCSSVGRLNFHDEKTCTCITKAKGP